MTFPTILTHDIETNQNEIKIKRYQEKLNSENQRDKWIAKENMKKRKTEIEEDEEEKVQIHMQCKRKFLYDQQTMIDTVHKQKKSKKKKTNMKKWKRFSCR